MSEIDELYCHEAETSQQILEQRQKSNELDGKIERLKAAKHTIAAHKDSVKSLRATVAGLMVAERWNGENYTKYQEKVREGLTQGFNDYHNAVDNAQDELNLEIAKLQNEKSSALGCIGDLQSWLNDIQTAIRNYFN